jgi:hypothetical protein
MTPDLTPDLVPDLMRSRCRNYSGYFYCCRIILIDDAGTNSRYGAGCGAGFDEISMPEVCRIWCRNVPDWVPGICSESGTEIVPHLFRKFAGYDAGYDAGISAGYAAGIDIRLIYPPAGDL